MIQLTVFLIMTLVHFTHSVSLEEDLVITWEQKQALDKVRVALSAIRKSLVIWFLN